MKNSFLDQVSLLSLHTPMKTFSVAHVKTNLSSILKEVESGEEIAISFGKKKEMIAVIVSYNVYKQSKKRKLGTLGGKMTVEFREDYKMSDKELLGKFQSNSIWVN